MSKRNCALYVDANDRYCCQRKVVRLKPGKCAVFSLANVGPVDLLVFPSGDTDETSTVVQILEDGVTRITIPGVYALDLPCEELDGTDAPENVQEQQVACWEVIDKEGDGVGVLISALEDQCIKLEAIQTALECQNIVPPEIPGFFVKEGPYCDQQVHLTKDGPVVLDTLTCAFIPIEKELFMSRTIGANPAGLNKVSRQITCEYCAEDGPLTITNASLMAEIAALALPYPAAPAVLIDPASAYLNEIWVGLAGIGDEVTLDDGSVKQATNCDAAATDVPAAKTTNLEPGGEWGFEYVKGVDVQDFEIIVAEGSVVRICVEVSACVNKAGDEAIPKPI